ncbi:right-handed parallel beta-helix repeat-containing protein [uncultured Gimesia sp.]|uniref:right-handed parallel beta-helix repeat-containing protein n=1 Tax=uncultured Gimesia sp. TaxID=1678688 RepID=UPI0030DAE699|tara:strand:- start:84840 stop:87260 length:2421 start_codon:yes stop_codon:yes gene_type:complete
MLARFLRSQSLLRLLICCIICFFLTSQSSAQDPEWFEEEDYLYRAYFDFTGMAGGVNETGQGLLFVPLSQDEESLFFADLRGNIFDNSSAEGNFGLAYRRMIDDQWIAGAYGFYDVRRSQYDNIFRQGSFGVELMSVEWDFRVNGYIPNMKQQRVDSLNTAYLSGNNIVMRAGEERAYWGTDFEVGRLLKTFENLNVDAELRGYVGGYYFDNSAPGFKEITGPRARVEFRMFDLPFLGNGSRVVLAGQYQHDDVRGSQGTGLLTVRIPLPGNGSSQKLSRFQRRMVNPIVRDLDIVLNQEQGPEEHAKLQLTGQMLNDITIIDANTASAEAVFNAAGADSVVLFDGSAGTISTASGFVFNNGQLALGGGKSVNVVGCNSGAVASFNYGSQPTVKGNDFTNNVFTMADNSSIVGMEIIGGQNGIYGNNLSGITIACNTVSSAFEDGVHLDGATSGSITGNTFTGNGLPTGNDGLEIENLTGGSITGNISRGNEYGYYFVTVNGGTISNNLAEQNTYDGFDFDTFNGGTFTQNRSQYNGEDGYYFDDFITGGVFSNNIAQHNGNFGFNLDGMSGGTLSGNQALDNAYAGFAFFDEFTGGTLSGNVALRNDDGFYFDDDVTGGTFSGNTANLNRYNGFYFADDVSNMTFTQNIANQNGGNGIKFGDTVNSGAVISFNMASGNDDDGFDFEDIDGGTIVNNTASGNMEDGFDFDNVFNSGTLSNNLSIGNIENGYDFSAPIIGGSISDNSAQQNAGDGFMVNLFGGGNTATFSNNSATDNTAKGYDVLSGTPQNGVGTNTGSNNGSDDDF